MMVTLNRSSRRFVIALGLVAMVLTGSPSAFARDDAGAGMTIEATSTTAMVGYLKLDGIAGESTSRDDGSGGNELTGDVDVDLEHNSSASTNDLRGKILRITPLED